MYSLDVCLSCLIHRLPQLTTELLTSPTTPESPTPHQSIQLSLQPDFSLSVTTTSLLGSRAKLQDLPKIEQLVGSRLRQAIAERVVWPRFFSVGLPSLGVGIARSPGGEDEDDFVLVDKEAGFGETLMKEVIPPPTGGVLRMMKDEGLGQKWERASSGLGGGVLQMPGGSDWNA